MLREFSWSIRTNRESWHFLPARIAYIYRRNRYDLKLLASAEFRRVVEIDDWLKENI